MSVRRANTRMKVNRYRDRGTTHISGTDAMSVEMYIVTPSIMLDGTKAQATQRRRRRAERRSRGSLNSNSAAPGSDAQDALAEVRRTATAQPTVRRRKSA